MARVLPVSREEWPPEMKEAVAAMAPARRRHPAPPRDGRTQGIVTLGAFAHHTELAKAFFTFNGHILWATTLTPRQREILVLRVAARRNSAYIWGEHLSAAHDAGLTDEEIERIAVGPAEAPLAEPLEAALLRAADELLDDGVVSDETWALLASHLDVQQLFDVVFTVGCYETTSFFLRSIDLEAAPGSAEMPQR